MGNRNLPKNVFECVQCIGPKNYNEGHSTEHVTASHRLYDAYMADDNDGFESELCQGCNEGLVPEHIPTSQVIRFIKNIFDKHEVII